mgnify:CR=1 FL=1
MSKDFSSSKLVLEVAKIKGNCPVYNIGDKSFINGPEIDLERSDKVCIHALFALGTFIVDLREGMNPSKIGLSKKEEGVGYFQCLDPGPPYTNGGTVLFKVYRKATEDSELEK